MGMSQSYGPHPGDGEAMIAVLRGAVERGVTLFVAIVPSVRLLTAIHRVERADCPTRQVESADPSVMS